VAQFKLGIRIGHGAKPIVGIIVRSADYYYIDHRSADRLAEIAERFGKDSVEWFNVLTEMSRLIASGVDLKPLGDVYMESPWRTVDAKAGATVGAYFKLLSADLRVSLESDRSGATYVIIAKDFASRGRIAREEVVGAIAHLRHLKTLLEASGRVTASTNLPIPMLDAIDDALAAVQGGADPADVQPLDCLGAALSSLLGYDSWATQSRLDADTALS
jgi:hypothetical protein